MPRCFRITYAKQCRDSLQQPRSCNLCSVLCSVSFRSSFVRSLLLDLDPYGGNDSNGMLSLFNKQVAREPVSKLTVIFRYLVRGGSFRHVGD